MKKNIKKLIALAMSIMTITPVKANAQLFTNSTGTWNSKGDIWSVGWEMINGSWLYFDSQGYMKTGWLLDNNSWYYLGESGRMQTGWVEVNEKWYYLDASGKMLANTMVDGYRLDEDGAMITDEIAAPIYNDEDWTTVYYNKNTLEIDAILTGCQELRDFYSSDKAVKYGVIHVDNRKVGKTTSQIRMLEFEQKVKVVENANGFDVVFAD